MHIFIPETQSPLPYFQLFSLYHHKFWLAAGKLPTSVETINQENYDVPSQDQTTEEDRERKDVRWIQDVLKIRYSRIFVGHIIINLIEGSLTWRILEVKFHSAIALDFSLLMGLIYRGNAYSENPPPTSSPHKS